MNQAAKDRAKKALVYTAKSIMVLYGLLLLYVWADHGEEESKEVEESSIEAQDSRPYVPESSEENR